ncbi:MAG: TetR/AcrR family transcriptional regulator C-terminal domain-containing protein [Caloramator sp.]|nr:TetR/AcrR family transcriptional regulator C-terminal domain-containing protein [Caloramator sp.]
MRSAKDDRRVKYTKMVLKESFIKLLSKKDISKITIKEICEDADINRATFYAHYSDQYDLMRKIENELLENISSYITEFAKKSNNFNDVELIEKIFEYIKENAQLCKLLLSKKGDLDFQKRVMMLVYDKNLIDLTNEGIFSREYADYIYSYTITGCVGIIQKWLEDGMDKSTRFMAEMIIRLTTYNNAPK